MKGIASIAILLCLVLLASGQAAAQQFGTKVQSGDPDVGLPLSTFSALVGGQIIGFINYWDIGTTPGVYDDKDVAYLKFGFPNPAVVQANSIRLTGWANYPAGSYVKPGDSDIGQSPLLPVATLPLPSALETTFYYMNVAGGAGYDLGDPIYLKIQSPPWVPPQLPIITGANDIRITANAGFPAGSRVSLNDPDAAKPLTAFKGPIAPPTGFIFNPGAAPIAQLAFYNANGNIQAPGQAIYDEGDVVYFDVQPLGVVSPNDVRLY